MFFKIGVLKSFAIFAEKHVLEYLFKKKHKFLMAAAVYKIITKTLC